MTSGQSSSGPFPPGWVDYQSRILVMREITPPNGRHGKFEVSRYIRDKGAPNLRIDGGVLCEVFRQKSSIYK